MLEKLRNLPVKKGETDIHFDTQWSWTHAYDCDEEEHRRTVPLKRFWHELEVWQCGSCGYCCVNSDSNRDRIAADAQLEHCHRLTAPFLCLFLPTSPVTITLHLEVLTRWMRVWLLCWAMCRQQPERYDLDADRCSLSTTNPFCPQPNCRLWSFCFKCEMCGKCNLRILSRLLRPRDFKSFNPTFTSDFIFYESATWYISMISVGGNVHDEEPVSNSNNQII